MNLLRHSGHGKSLAALLLGMLCTAAVAGCAVSTNSDESSAAGVPTWEEVTSDSAPAKEENIYLCHDGDTLDRIVTVSEGTNLTIKSDQKNQNAIVQVGQNGGFVVEDGASVTLENVSLNGADTDHSVPVFTIYGDMTMNGGSVEDFSSTTEGSESGYGKGGMPAICIVDGTFTMNGGSISGNSNTTTKEIALGGAVRASGTDAAIIINDGTISGNTVLSYAEVPNSALADGNALGGGIAVTEGASLRIYGGELTDNTAGSHDVNAPGADNAVCSGSGGAIAVYSSDEDAISSIALAGGSIVGNHAYRSQADQGAAAPRNNETHGGGIFSNLYTRAVLTAGRVAENTSDDKGGGLFLDSDKAYGGASFINTLVTKNEATSLGGGLWFCPDGESNMYSTAKSDGIAVFDNTTSRRGTNGAGDDLYVSPRSDGKYVMVASTMPGGGQNNWFNDGGAGTQTKSSYDKRYYASATEAVSTVLKSSAMINVPAQEAKASAAQSAALVITDNKSSYGGGIGSNHYLNFGTPTDKEREESGVPDVADTETEPETEPETESAAEESAAAESSASSETTVSGDSGGSSGSSSHHSSSSNDDDDDDDDDDSGSGTTSTTEADTTETTAADDEDTETTSVSVSKVWVGDAGTSATVHLLANGIEATSADLNATLTADNDWSHTFTGLDKTDSEGNAIAYSISEDSINGYSTNITGDVSSGFIVTNTEIIKEKTSAPVTVIWIGGVGDSATVHLYGNDVEKASATLTADADWIYTFTDLDKTDSDGNEIAYTLTEDAIDGYSSSITGDASSGFIVTNTKNETDKTSVTVTKEWVGDAGASATVHLFANGAQVASATLTADDEWTHTFTDLDKTDSDGNEIAYTITEDAIDGYESSITDSDGNGFTVKNTPEKIDIPVTKKWIGEEGTSATVYLLANDVQVASATLTADNSWTSTFKDLDQVDSDGNTITYTIAEMAIDGYISEVSGDASSGFTVTNIETVNVHVTKNWAQGIEDSVTIRLIRNGASTNTTISLSATTDTDENDSLEGWSNDFTDLPKYDANGNKITYSVSEEFGSEYLDFVYDYYLKKNSEYDFTVYNYYHSGG